MQQKNNSSSHIGSYFYRISIVFKAFSSLRMEKIILISLLSILINLQILNAKANYKVTMAIQPPFIEKYRDDAGTIAYRGYLIDLIREIATQVDFQYEIYEVPDGKFGSFNRSKPDEWTGVIRELIDKVSLNLLVLGLVPCLISVHFKLK